ncbi:Tetraspanin-11 [Halotydeus destructor]|nr:Tetraspanin-11 [Halotydeus destructor]
MPSLPKCMHETDHHHANHLANQGHLPVTIYLFPFQLDQIGGITVFSIGVWTLSDKSFMERLLGSNLYVASAAILIATGVVVAIISFLGTLGAYREIRCMLITFFVILFMIFIVMLVGGILGYIFRSEVSFALL